MESNKRKKISTIVRACLSGVLILYIFFAIFITSEMNAKEKVHDVKVIINTKDKNNFITSENLLSELRDLPADTQLIKDINLSEMEKSLRSFVNIEKAEVTRTPQGSILINVTPMIPVARVFDSDGYSYYINREGKKLKADMKYHVDVPIIYGCVDDGTLSAVELLPIMNYISRDTLLNSLTSALKVDANHDLILIPNIKGHVVNLGNVKDRNLDDKFNRLLIMYKEVLPYKGWQYYDTLSVKFMNQVVATRSKKREATPYLLYETFDSEEVDLDNMNTSDN